MADDTPKPDKAKKPFPFDKARESILSIPEITKVRFLKTEDEDLKRIEALSDGSITGKRASSKIQSILILDLDYEVSHKLVRVSSPNKDFR